MWISVSVNKSAKVCLHLHKTKMLEIWQVLIYFYVLFFCYITLIFSICYQPSTPTLQEHNLLIPKVFLNWKGFWLHHCSFQTCAKFPERLWLHFLCNTTNFYRTDSPPFFFPLRIQLTCSSTTAAFLSASVGLHCPIQGFPPRAGKWTRPQTLTRS